MPELKKRLYTVTIEFEYAVLAADSYDAVIYASDALDDVFVREYAHATETVYLPGKDSKTPVIRRPEEYDDTTLIYGTDKDTTFGDAVAAEVTALTADIDKEEFDKKQGKLF